MGGESLRALWRASLAILIVPLLAPAGAGAGTYDVYICRLPGGAVEASSFWTGWTEVRSGALPTPAAFDCGQGGGLRTSLADGQAVGANAGWSFEAPQGTT